MKIDCLNSKLPLRKVLTLFLVVIGLSFSALTAEAQDDIERSKRQRIINLIPKHVPVKVEILNNDLDTPLEKIKIKITNTGEKPIYFLNLYLDSLEEIAGDKLGFRALKYGNINLGDLSVAPQQLMLERADSESIAKDEFIELSLTKGEVEGFHKMLLRRNYAGIPRFGLSLSVLSYGDGAGFLTPSAKPVPQQDKEPKEETKPSNQDFFFNFIKYSQTTVEPKACGASPDKLLQNGFNFDGGNFLACNCRSGTGCGLIKPKLGHNVCCQPPHTPAKTDGYEYAPGCGVDPNGYVCGEHVDRLIPCSGGDIPECYESRIKDCDGQDIVCTDADNDGYYKDSSTCPIRPIDCNDDPGNGGAGVNPAALEICDDVNGVDENCDGAANCQSEYCRNQPNSFCDYLCDRDDDGFYDKQNSQCGGTDCVDNPSENPNAANIHPGQSENTAAFCNDPNSNDEDCDNDSNCEDDECANFCAPTPTPTPTPTPGGGDGNGDGNGECPCNDCVNGCEDPGESCGWQTVDGQCYGGVYFGDCWDSYGAFNGTRENCQYSEPYCDSPQEVWVCQ